MPKEKDEEKTTSWDALKKGVKLKPGHRTILIVEKKKPAKPKSAT